MTNHESSSEQPKTVERSESGTEHVRLVSTPRRVERVEAATLKGIIAATTINTREMTEAVPEAYAAALEAESAIPQGAYEMVGCTLSDLPRVEGKKAAEVAAEFVEKIDPGNPWRFATLAELVDFVASNPQLVGDAVFVALGQTDLGHYPMCVRRTRDGIQLAEYQGGLTQVGTTILVARVSTAEAGTVTEEEELALEAVEESSYEAVVQQFYRELEKVSESDREQLREIVDVTQLFGEKYRNLRSELGDVVTDKIMNEVIRARIPTNQPGPDGLYRIAEERWGMCLANIERAGQSFDEATKERVLAILSDPDLLNSEVMNLRERAKVVHSALAGLQKTLANDVTFPPAELEQLRKLQKMLSSDIGNQNQLQLIHPHVE